MRHTVHLRYVTILKRRQGAMLVIGIMIFACGSIFLCNIAALATVSWPVIGLMLCTTSAMQLAAALQTRERVKLIAWLPVVIFYVLFGAFSLTEPSRQLAFLGLVFFVGMIATGALRSYCGFRLRQTNGWCWLVAAGLATVSAGAFLMSRWPDNSLTIAGTLIALDLMIYGAGFIGFSLKVHLPRSHDGS